MMILEEGYWCQAEGMYFTDRSEHYSEETQIKQDRGWLGHFGYECEGRKQTVKVGVVVGSAEAQRVGLV